MTRSAPTVAVVLLITLTGCTGALAGDEGLPGGATLDSVEYPDGYDEDGITNATEVFETQQDVLRYEGATVTVTQNSSDSEFASTVRIDADARRIHGVSERDDGTDRETYYEDETEYTHTGDGVTADYASTYERSVRYAVGGHIATVRSFNFTATEVTAVRGTTVIRYDVTGIDRANATVDPEDVERVDGTLLVDQEGRIHRFAYEVTIDDGIESETYRMTYDAKEFGATSVDRPDWVEDHRSG